jgi:hypothetical protein
MERRHECTLSAAGYLPVNSGEDAPEAAQKIQIYGYQYPQHVASVESAPYGGRRSRWRLNVPLSYKAFRNILLPRRSPALAVSTDASGSVDTASCRASPPQRRRRPSWC